MTAAPHEAAPLEEDSMGVVVVETEPAEPAPESTPVAVAEAVTPGELGARLELLERNLDDRISNAVRIALDAQDAAADAQETAQVAAVVAAVAAEEVAQEAEVGAEDDAGAGDDDAQEDENDAPRPPERRSEHSEQSDAGERDQKPKKSSGYGAGWLSSR